ncbi:MAG: hypothetical protein VYD05_04785, partial [Planctomycetota bacterium]|nr:hypothetical protein [Planctomycetota bacterium]
MTGSRVSDSELDEGIGGCGSMGCAAPAVGTPRRLPNTALTISRNTCRLIALEVNSDEVHKNPSCRI